ncbi:hypothetical protein GS682_18500 [Nostoc sp. B(2019)]|nr:hypothetical protein [Nostoc sp. B(2019)]
MDWKTRHKLEYEKLIKKKPTKVDWIVAGGLIALVSPLVVFGIFFKEETQQECINRVGKEIVERKRTLGETTVKNREEIEAYGEEFKRKCNLVF